MPVESASSDRKVVIWFGITIFLLVVLVFFFTPEDPEGPRFPSTYSAHSRGAKAVFLLLQESGYKVERWTVSPTGLPEQGSGTMLILADPALIPEKEEREALTRYILGGGRVLAIGRSGAALLPRDDSKDLSVPQVDWNEIPPALPSRLTRGGAIKTNLASKWVSTDAGDLVHYLSPDGAAIVSYRYGAGEVIWWASATPLTNAGAQERGNLELLLNSIGDDRPKIYWDEFFHGQRTSLWSKVSDTPLKWLLLQVGAFAVALLLTFSRRSGPIQALHQRSRLSPLEFVETLGSLYKRARASGFALEVAYGRFRSLITRKLGLRRDASPDALASAVRERFGYNDANLLETLNKCETAVIEHNLPDREALALTQALHAHARALRILPRSSEEKH